MRLRRISSLLLHNTKKMTSLFFYVLLGTVVVTMIAPDFLLSEEYESYYNQLDTYPDDKQSILSEECQGVTNDGEHWFFPRNYWTGFPDFEPYLGRIIKVRFDVALNPLDSCFVDGVLCVHLENITELDEYNHIGDISFFRYIDHQGKTHGFLLAPFEHTIDRPIPAVGLFNAETVEYISQAKLPLHEGFNPYVAVDPNGFVYVGRAHNEAGYVYKYFVNWEQVVTEEIFAFDFMERFPLLLEDGMTNSGMALAGADFSPSGNLFYTSSEQGVDVFDMQTKKRVRHILRDWPEPEGLTIVDVDSLPPSRQPPNISGQLHVVYLNNDDSSNDNIWFLHFTNKVYVDAANTGDGNGKPETPFQTVNAANDALWDGGVMSIATGSYSESVTITKKIRLEGTGGDVTIGP